MSRLEIAAWTTIGMVRTGNEDAFALLHASNRVKTTPASRRWCCCATAWAATRPARSPPLWPSRSCGNIPSSKSRCTVTGASSFPGDVLSTQLRPEGQGHAAPPIDVEDMKKTLKAALKEANKQIYTGLARSRLKAARHGLHRRGRLRRWPQHRCRPCRRQPHLSSARRPL